MKLKGQTGSGAQSTCSQASHVQPSITCAAEHPKFSPTAHTQASSSGQGLGQQQPSVGRLAPLVSCSGRKRKAHEEDLQSAVDYALATCPAAPPLAGTCWIDTAGNIAGAALTDCFL